MYLAKQSMFGITFHNICFSKRFDGFGLFGSRLRTANKYRVRTVAGPHAGASTVSGGSAGDLESLTRTRDILF